MLQVLLILSALAANLVALVYGLVKVWRFSVARYRRWRRRDEEPWVMFF